MKHSPLPNRLIILLLSLLLLGCAPEASNLQPTLQATAPPIAVEESETPHTNEPDETPLPTAEPTAVLPPAPTVRPTDTPAPTPTPQPLTLAVPEQWQAAAEETAALLNNANQWQLTLVATGETADLTLTNQPSDNSIATLVHQEPLAVAIPFLTNWHDSPLSQAKEILANGHDLAVVAPWRELPFRQRALHIDGLHPSDVDYPLTDDYFLVASDGVPETAVADIGAALATAMADDVVRLTAVGDIMLDRFLGEQISDGDLAYPFAKTAALLSQADLTIGNVESALGNVGEPVAKAYPFRAPPEAAEALALAGFDVVSLANNHGMDYGEEALLQALDLLHAAGVAPIGAGTTASEARAPHLVTLNELTVALLGYVNVPVESSTAFDVATWTATESSPGLAWAEPALVAADVAAAKETADFVIVVLHSGYEYVDPPSPEQLEISQAAVAAGADLIIGHHAHILQAVQYLEESLIVYGLGNFAFHIDGPPETAVLNVWIDENGIREFELVPAIVQFGGQPRLAEPWEAEPILRRVYTLSRPLNP